MKIFIDDSKTPPSGWIHIKDYQGLKLLLNTVKISEIETIDLKYELSEHVMDFNGEDCINLLVDRANGQRLPQCLVHGPDTQGIIDIVEHYNQSYSYDNDCVKIVSKVGI